MFNIIKEKLVEDINLILDILEELECHDIKNFKDEIRCALPESSNGTSVRIIKNNLLHVDIFSRHDFDDFEISDIFSLVQYIRKCKLLEAVNFVCAIANIEYDDKKFEYKRSESIKEIRRFKPKKKEELKHDILDESFLNQYDDFIVKEWVEEGIDAETQKLFGVKISKKDKRWLIPIRDEFARLISTKGRTYVNNYDLKGIYKYLYKPSMGGFNDILFGYYLTAPYIHNKDEVIVVEAEKSVMKAWAMGEKNFVASGKAGLNHHLVKKIIQVPCKRVVLAYDKDIGIDEIQKDIDSLKHYKEVYYILDTEDVLGKKDSPVDKGFWEWITLYDKRKRGK